MDINLPEQKVFLIETCRGLIAGNCKIKFVYFSHGLICIVDNSFQFSQYTLLLKENKINFNFRNSKFARLTSKNAKSSKLDYTFFRNLNKDSPVLLIPYTPAYFSFNEVDVELFCFKEMATL